MFIIDYLMLVIEIKHAIERRRMDCLHIALELLEKHQSGKNDSENPAIKQVKCIRTYWGIPYVQTYYLKIEGHPSQALYLKGSKDKENWVTVDDWKDH